MRVAILTFLIVITNFSFGQTIDTNSTKITGKWILVKHILLENGKLSNKLTNNQTFTYEFNIDGTYTWKCIDKSYGITTFKGKWEIADNGRTIHLYDNSDEPDDPKVTIADHDLKIINLTATEFITEEYLFSENPIGKSYFKKQ